MSTLAIIQARMGSTRLPGKVLKILAPRMTTLDFVVRAIEGVKGIHNYLVATTDGPRDQDIIDWCDQNHVLSFDGDEHDVLKRYIDAVSFAENALKMNIDTIVRITGDCPLIDPRVVDEVIRLKDMMNVDYATNTDPPSYPDGLDVEVFTRRALELANKEATRGTDRETVTRYIVRNRHRFTAANLTCPLPGLVKERWVLDSPEDYDFLQKVVGGLEDTSLPPSYLDILAVLDREPSLRLINGHLTRNERFYDALETDSNVGYEASKHWLGQTNWLIPMATQTFSKSHKMFPTEAPSFINHSDGGYCYDIDGNDYIDLVGGLLPNILGHRDPDVAEAIRRQLDNGISFSLASQLEYQLAIRLKWNIPGAEMVRFGKNGSDVTTAAIRLARHLTGRSLVKVGGYHGWHDWSVANDPIRNNGVPEDVKRLSTRDADLTRDVAAVIIEPEFFTKQSLQTLKDRCLQCGAMLIFDEIISGFRFGLGGLQKEYDIIPDLSTFGKAMGNGMPISALVGKADYMKHLPEISFSGTFFGETLSLAAALATLEKLERDQVPHYLADIGKVLRYEISMLIEKHNNTDIELYGHPVLNRIRFKNPHTQSVFIQQMARHGVLIIGSHNTCFAHKEPQIKHIIKAWDQTLGDISNGVLLEGEVIKGQAVR